jgi:hypothetical protein
MDNHAYQQRGSLFGSRPPISNRGYLPGIPNSVWRKDFDMSPTSKITEAADAILSIVPEGYGMTREEALNYARAVIKCLASPTEEMKVKAVLVASEKATEFASRAEMVSVRPRLSLLLPVIVGNSKFTDAIFAAYLSVTENEQ